MQEFVQNPFSLKSKEVIPRNFLQFLQKNRRIIPVWTILRKNVRQTRNPKRPQPGTKTAIKTVNSAKKQGKADLWRTLRGEFVRGRISRDSWPDAGGL